MKGANQMITLSDCSCWFKDKKKVVKAMKHMTFSVKEGEVVGILGENGAGKTTLLRVATLLEPTTESHCRRL
ncbi:ABC transporter ATP-binding protein [Bacillus safensis FO-36b] [Bacillus safensis subsp. safensis]